GEIPVIGHAIQTEPARPAVAERLRVLEEIAVASGAELAVVRKDLDARIAGVVGVEIPELAAQLQSALAHHARVERGITVGRDVPVVRDRQLRAGRGRAAVMRREYPRLALIL